VDAKHSAREEVTKKDVQQGERHTDWLTTKLARTWQLQRDAKSSRNFWIPTTRREMGVALSRYYHDRVSCRRSGSSRSQAQQSADNIHTLLSDHAEQPHL